MGKIIMAGAIALLLHSVLAEQPHIEATTRPGLGGWVQNVLANGGPPASMVPPASATPFGDSRAARPGTRTLVRFGF